MTVESLARAVTKRPLLIAKQNHYPTLMFLHIEHARELDGLGVGVYSMPHCIFNNDSYKVYCCDFKSFLEETNPEFLCRMGTGIITKKRQRAELKQRGRIQLR